MKIHHTRLVLCVRECVIAYLSVSNMQTKTTGLKIDERVMDKFPKNYACLSKEALAIVLLAVAWN